MTDSATYEEQAMLFSGQLKPYEKAMVYSLLAIATAMRDKK